MMIAVAAVALGFSACSDDDDKTVDNVSFNGSWKIIEDTNITTAFTTPAILVDSDNPAAPVSFTFNGDGNGELVFTALVEEPYDLDGDDVYDGTELVEKSLTAPLTYTLTDGTDAVVNGVSDHLSSLEIIIPETEYFKEVTLSTRYSIKGDLMYIYLKYPQSPDVLRKM